MTLRGILASLSMMAFAGSVAFAQSAGECPAKAAADNKACSATKTCSADAKACSASKECDKSKALASAPKMMYRVGDKTTCCPEEAGKLANGDRGAIQYVVGEQVFENEADAQVVLAKALDGYLAELTSVKFAVGGECTACPETAKSLAAKEGKPVMYRLASFEFASKEQAEKVAAEAKQAAEKVAMQRKVGEKSYCCQSMASDAAKKEGKPVEYCVGGKTTCCASTASLELAMAKINAAAEAIAKAAQG